MVLGCFVPPLFPLSFSLSLLSPNKCFHSLALGSPFFALSLSSSLWSALIPFLPLPFPNFLFLFLLLSVLPSVPLSHREPGQCSIFILKDTFPNSSPHMHTPSHLSSHFPVHTSNLFQEHKHLILVTWEPGKHGCFSSLESEAETHKNHKG